MLLISLHVKEKRAIFPADRGHPRDSTRFLVEFLNKFPPYHLYFKKGMVLMLLRSLASKQGLCNSTRLSLNKDTNILLYCKIASGEYHREEVLIPIIEIKRRDEQFIELNRRQFPVRPTFAMTINKTQGQTQRGSLASGAYIHSW